MKDIATKGDCIIVGRGADIILSDYNPMNIFVYADKETKMKRCQRNRKPDEQFSEKELEKKIEQIDKNRRDYHNMLSNLEWGDKKNYDLCINTSNIEIKSIISPLADYIDNWFKSNKQ